MRGVKPGSTTSDIKSSAGWASRSAGRPARCCLVGNVRNKVRPRRPAASATSTASPARSGLYFEVQATAGRCLSDREAADRLLARHLAIVDAVVRRVAVLRTRDTLQSKKMTSATERMLVLMDDGNYRGDHPGRGARCGAAATAAARHGGGQAANARLDAPAGRPHGEFDPHRVWPRRAAPVSLMISTASTGPPGSWKHRPVKRPKPVIH